MAGRYLLIEFDDEQSASSLRAQIDAASKKGKKFRVVGLFARPGKPCTCSIIGERSKDLVKQGSKFGWWLCQRCGKPRLGNHQLKNLIIPTEVIEPAQFDGVDMLSVTSEEIPYIRHASFISLITLPEKVLH